MIYRASDPISLRCTPEVLRFVGEMQPIEAHELLRATGIIPPFDEVDTDVRAIPDPSQDGYDTLHVASFVQLHDENPDEADLVSDLLNRLADDEIPVARLDYNQVVVGSDSSASEPGEGWSLVSPFLGGKYWTVKSDLERYREGVRVEEGPLSETMHSHAVALNALMVEILNFYPEHGIGEEQGGPIELFLTVPNEHPPALGPGRNDDEPEEERYRGIKKLYEFYGIDDVVQELRDVVTLANMTIEERERLGIEQIQSVLLYGPSGVGKTDLLKSLGAELDADIRTTSFSEVGSMWTGKWAEQIEKIFTDAFEHFGGRVLIVFDEMDGLVNSGNESSTRNITAVLKVQLERMRDFPHVFFAGATNDVDALASELLADKRIQTKEGVGLPDTGSRAILFAAAIESTGDFAPVDAVSTEAQQARYDYDEFADQTEGFSPGDIFELVAQARRKAVLTTANIDEPAKISNEQVHTAITRARRSRPQ